jgi:hypothetical protein
MHCQTETAKFIRDNEADNSLQIKNNQGNLLKEIKVYFHKVHRATPSLLEQHSGPSSCVLWPDLLIKLLSIASIFSDCSGNVSAIKFRIIKPLIGPSSKPFFIHNAITTQIIKRCLSLKINVSHWRLKSADYMK